MSAYTPDLWVIVKITPVDKTYPPYKRVLASWYGGFVGSNSWKLSSGNESCIDNGDHWFVPQTSGSTYKLGKSLYGMSAYTASIFESLKKESANYVTIELMNEPTNEKDFT